MAEHLGVRHVYEELEPVGMEGPPSGTLAPTSPDLQGLLAEWLAACRSSASRGHSELLLELIDQIRADHAQVAEGLTGLVHALRFRTIVTLTEQAEGQL